MLQRSTRLKCTYAGCKGGVSVEWPGLVSFGGSYERLLWQPGLNESRYGESVTGVVNIFWVGP